MKYIRFNSILHHEKNRVRSECEYKYVVASQVKIDIKSTKKRDLPWNSQRQGDQKIDQMPVL